MKIRNYQPSDAEALKRIADDSPFPYENPDSPLIEACLVLTDDDGEILAAAAAKKILELYFWKDSNLSPAVTKTAIDLFHAEMGTLLRGLGYHNANTFLHPSICERFGRRLIRTWGWVRNWPSFCGEVLGGDMGRGNDTAQAASKNALGYSGALQGQQNALYSTLAPALTRDIANPVGLNPTEKANANTAAQESIGGSQSAAVGQGALNAQRTRNAGSADAAVQESARQGGRQLSQAALGTEMADAELKQRKMAAAKGEMAGLYGTSTTGGNQALGEVANNVDANTQAENASWNWAKYILDPAMQAAGSAAGGYLSKPRPPA